MNSGYCEYFATMEGGAGNSDKEADEKSDALPSEGDSADIQSMKHVH